MTHRSTWRKALIVAGIGLAAVVASPPANLVLPAMGAVMAVRALRAGAGKARVVPAAVLVAIVVGTSYAPVKTIKRVKARRLTMPKPAMTVAELRDPIGQDPAAPVPPVGGPADESRPLLDASSSAGGRDGARRRRG
jgi:hypothetical protein